MRIPAWPTFAILPLAMILFSSRPAQAQSKCTENWPTERFSLAGRLDDGDIRAYLDVLYHPESVEVSAVAIFPSRWKPQNDSTVQLSLNGTFTDDCQIQLDDSSGGVWRLRLVGQRFVGTRERPRRPPATVSLRIVDDAVDCSGSGAWRTFASPGWPITFDYPASWRLADNGDDIVVECPDAKRLAWGGAPIWFRLGHGREDGLADDGRRGTRIDRFVTFRNDQWLIGDTCEHRPPDDLGVYCNVARQSTWRGMTVLQGAAGEHRKYRPGGSYLGQGSGIVSYAFLIGDTWVVIHSHNTPALIDHLDSPGPVLFDGNGVTERMVRSIRLR